MVKVGEFLLLPIQRPPIRRQGIGRNSMDALKNYKLYEGTLPATWQISQQTHLIAVLLIEFIDWGL
jgi:hypothetical protein